MEEECAGGRSRLHQAACHFDMQIRIQTLSAAVKQQDAVGDHMCPDAACCFMSPQRLPSSFLLAFHYIMMGWMLLCVRPSMRLLAMSDADVATVTEADVMILWNFITISIHHLYDKRLCSGLFSRNKIWTITESNTQSSCISHFVVHLYPLLKHGKIPLPLVHKEEANTNVESKQRLRDFWKKHINTALQGRGLWCKEGGAEQSNERREMNEQRKQSVLRERERNVEKNERSERYELNGVNKLQKRNK